MSFQVGDLVTRNSYGNDLLFRITFIEGKTAILHGEEVRLEADAPFDDLFLVGKEELKERRDEGKKQVDFSYRLFRQDYLLMKEKLNYYSTAGYEQSIQYFQLPVKVLHLDGDPIYLRKCIELYKRLGIQVHGIHLDEKEMPMEIGPLLTRIQPEVVVVTGHDAYSKNKGPIKDLNAYRNSKFFSETVREARRIVPNLDQLIIFAGACQSHFESLIRAGANFASAPSRVNIHALDPVYVSAKIAYTSFMKKVTVWEVLRNTLTGEDGLGGVETKGLHRTGMPYIENADITNE